jgi:hypothetical protein
MMATLDITPLSIPPPDSNQVENRSPIHASAAAYASPENGLIDEKLQCDNPAIALLRVFFPL